MSFNKMESIYLKLLKVRNLLNNNISSLAKDFGFNSTELMMYLDIKTNPNTTLNEVCNRLSLKKSLASKTLSKLIEENYIVKEYNEADQRKISLRHIEVNDPNLCKEVVLTKTFKGSEKSDCNLEKIDFALDESIKILTE